jgi:hypothetical protein
MLPTLLSLAIGLFSGAVTAQTPRDVARPAAAGTSVLTGRITVIARQPLPVRRARVVLESDAIDAPRTTMADTDGRYRFAELPPGSYRVRAEKSGYVTLAHGARRFGDPGAPVAVNAGATAVADIALPRGAAIEGRIVDESGEPRANLIVSATRLAYGPYGRRPAAVRETRTDDLGRYRLHSLAAGTYHVMGAPDPLAGLSRPPGAPRLAAARTFYPGTANLAEATRVTVSAGQDVSGVDFAAAAAQMAELRVSIAVSTGGKAASTGARLQTVGAPPGGISGYKDESDTVRFTSVPPGDYWAMAAAVATAGAAPEYAIARLTVAGGDTRTLTLTTERAAIVLGRLEVDAGQLQMPKPLDVVAHAVGIELPSIPGGVAAGDTTVRVAPDGTFSFPSLYGPRMFRVPNLPAGWALAGVFLDDAAITDAVTEFRQTPTPQTLRLVVTSRLGSLAGKATDANRRVAPGARVVVFSQDERLWMFRSRHVHSVLAGADGSYVIAGLLPGRYLACAIDELNEGDWFDPDVLRSLKPDAAAIDAAGGESQTLTLTVRLPL